MGTNPGINTNPPPFFAAKPPPLETFDHTDHTDDSASTASTAVSVATTPRGQPDGPCDDYTIDLHAAFGTCTCGYARRDHRVSHALARRATVASTQDMRAPRAEPEDALNSSEIFCPAAPAASSYLPQGWISQTDPSSGHTFFANTKTGETSWEAPPALSVFCPPPPAAPSAGPAATHSWESAAQASPQQPLDPWKLHRPAQHSRSEPKPPVAAPKPRRATEPAIFIASATLPQPVCEPRIASSPCAAFKLDMTAAFGTCRCGHKKVAHSYASFCQWTPQ